MGKRFIKWGFIAILFILCACNKNEQYKERILKMKSKPINVTKEKMKLVYCNIKDSTNLYGGDKTDSLLWIVYADSFVCSSCKLSELQYWNEFIHKARKKCNSIDFCFIFSPREEDRDIFMFTAKSLKLASLIYLDTLRTFPQNNPQIPKDQRFHTFLLDKNKNVILVGDPVKNEKINNIFWKILDENRHK
ncbi:MAG: hypothetical protein Q4F85_08435 [Prevotella sp.]|nr:hypothetical protein [Prevotella sp.]